MRSLVAGTDEAGRSCILQEVPIEERGVEFKGPTFRQDVYALRENPPPPRPPARSEHHDPGIAPGHADFLVVQMPARVEHPMYHTDTLNFHTILAGSVELVLDDGPHALEVGDTLVLPGIDHGWRTGPKGLTMAVLLLGSARP